VKEDENEQDQDDAVSEQDVSELNEASELEDDDDDDDDDEEETPVTVVIIQGKQYLRDDQDLLYDPLSQAHVGYFVNAAFVPI
jgi:hypothetical protein